ncbi:MAG: hypothetical protein H0U00_02810 [Actinobacteria bacterium]|nr:hypothetical protein [Actinomycetota bacterium]
MLLVVLLLAAATGGYLMRDTPGARPVSAFPTAEGFGSNAVGGRRGQVIKVTNLHDAGPGSLRNCLIASWPRICTFAVGGTIALQSSVEITNPYVTVAGQTAPGGGITVRAGGAASSRARTTDVHIKIKTHDVIIRYLRLRPGTKGRNARALSINGPRDAQAYNVVVDHNSLSWAGDEILIAWDDTRSVTFSWNNLSESLDNGPFNQVGLKGPNLGDENGGFYSFHHNLVAHHSQRLPNISAGAGPTDVVNNLMYNAGGTGSRVLMGAMVNFVGNYIKSGPNTTLKTWFSDDGARGFYLGGENSVTDNSNVVVGKSVTLLSGTGVDKISSRFPAPAVTTTSALTAFNDVLSRAGAIHGLKCDGTWFTRRDSVDRRIVSSVKDGVRGHAIEPDRTFERRGYISYPEDVGGWPQLQRGFPCSDTDNDGMPNVWELRQGLNPKRDDSAKDRDRDGYTNVEEYINGT